MKVFAFIWRYKLDTPGMTESWVGHAHCANSFAVGHFPREFGRSPEEVRRKLERQCARAGRQLRGWTVVPFQPTPDGPNPVVPHHPALAEFAQWTCPEAAAQ